MNENQEKNNIIESYDGDPDDLMFFQTPSDEEYDLDDEDIIVEPAEVHKEEFVLEPEVVEVTPDTEPANHPWSRVPQESEYVQEVKAEIDWNDPHYVNYQPDPYYEFGQGPEPKAQKVDDKKEGTSLGVVSLCTAIAANLMCCCGANYILSLTAIVTGIWCLCLKNTDKSTKVMAIIGIILALLPFVLLFLNLFSSVLFDLYGYTY